MHRAQGRRRDLCPELPTFDEAVALLASRRVGLHVDLKWHGYELAALEVLRRHGVLDRSLVSSFHARSLHVLSGEEPSLALGLTYPFDRFQASARRALAPAVVATLLALRRTLPRRIGRLLTAARASVAVLHFSVVSPAVVVRCHALGVPVVAWTVDDREKLRRLDAAGVDGVVTNDPGLFRG